MPDDNRPTPKPDFSQIKVQAPQPAAPKPDFSNVKSGGSSTAPVVHAEKAEKVYTVKAGDSLSKIAKHEYGDAGQWRRIFEANQDTIKNPDLIHPGQVLRIPEANATAVSDLGKNQGSGRKA